MKKKKEIKLKDEISKINDPNDNNLVTVNYPKVEKEEKDFTKSVEESICKKEIQIFEGYNDFLEEPRNFAKTNAFENDYEEKKNNYPNQEKIIIRPIVINFNNNFLNETHSMFVEKLIRNSFYYM